MCDILNYDGYTTVDSLSEKYSTFMHYEETIDDVLGLEDVLVGTLEPITEENKDITDDTTDTSSRFKVLIKFFTALINFLTSLFKK